MVELGISKDNLGCYRAGEWVGNGAVSTSTSPHTNKAVASTRMASLDDYGECIKAMQAERVRWAKLPAPQRGEIVR